MAERIIALLKTANSWADFRAGVQPMTKKEKGDCFEELTKHFLLLDPTYATKLKKVWLLLSVPPDIHELLNLPGPDEGIDLVAETKEGEFWAIQCKYREDETSTLTRTDLSTFTDLAFTICTNISLALVCTSADRFSHKLKRYGDRLTFCAGDVWRGLDEEFFTRLHQHWEGKVTRPIRLTPRPHQLRAIGNAHKHFIRKGNSRGKMIMPCGTGKSLAALWIAEKLGGRTILVAVPSLALIRQTLKVWTRESVAKGTEINWICVCSDESVAEVESDDVVVLTQDLGVRVHTDSKEIAAWLQSRKNDHTVVFTTYHSGPALAKACKKARTVFDVGILDEAHKTVGRENATFGHLLYDKNIRIKKRIFMTATERRYIGASDEIASMEDPRIYGHTFERLSIKEALEARPPILCDYKVVTIEATHSEVSKLIKRNLLVRPDRGTWSKDVEARMLAATIAMRKSMLDNPINHAVSFHNSVARARAFRESQESFTKAFPSYGPLKALHVSGSMRTSDRDRILLEFAHAERALITNARCLTEGIDIPTIDCVLFADPRQSKVDIVQAVGRALRPAEGKELGYVVLPVLLPKRISETSFRDTDAFEEIVSTLRALGANDERIIEYFRTVSRGHQWRGGAVPVDIDIRLGRKISADVFAKSIELEIWSRLAKLAWQPFEQAREFVRKLGLRNWREWRAYSTGETLDKGLLPEDIPNHPMSVYRNSGWVSVGDWLGTGTIAPRLRKYRSFTKARAFVRQLGLKSQAEWNAYAKGQLHNKKEIPKDIPANPNFPYADKGWQGIGDWLGTGTIASQLRKYRSFKRARAFVRQLGLTSSAEWNAYRMGRLPQKGKRPQDIPSNANKTYEEAGWQGMGDWLGTGTIATFDRNYRPFTKARKFARQLGLKSRSQWNAYTKGQLLKKRKFPDAIPAYPDKTYRDRGWQGWGDWLGTGTIAPRLRKYRSFTKARAFVRQLGLTSSAEWNAYTKGKLLNKQKLPEDIPRTPSQAYEGKGWQNLGDWLGTGTTATYLRKYRSFTKARTFVRQLGLKNRAQWNAYTKGQLLKKKKLPEDIPANPSRQYKGKGWQGYGDWLGTGTIATFDRTFRPFKRARAFVRQLGLNSTAEWDAYCTGRLPQKGKRPQDIPSNPNKTYKGKGWQGIGDWLGTANRKRPKP